MLGDHLELSLDAGGDRIVHRIEYGHHPIACRLQHTATRGLHGGAEYRVVTRQGNRHLLGMLFPETRARLDVGEEESLDQPGGDCTGVG